jgi:hypothetical protein
MTNPTPAPAPPVLDISHPCGSLSYADEKFACAVHMMAVGEAPLRARIVAAFEEFHPVGEEDFPEGSTLRAEFVALLARLTWAEDREGHGTLDATLAIISDSEVRALARLIVNLASGIQAELEHHRCNALCAAETRIRELTGEEEEPPEGLYLLLDDAGADEQGASDGTS